MSFYKWSLFRRFALCNMEVDIVLCPERQPYQYFTKSNNSCSSSEFNLVVSLTFKPPICNILATRNGACGAICKQNKTKQKPNQCYENIFLQHVVFSKDRLLNNVIITLLPQAFYVLVLNQGLKLTETDRIWQK